MKRMSNSFRDPSGFVYTDKGRIFRLVLKCAEKEWQQFIASGLFCYLQEKRYIQSTKLLSSKDWRSNILPKSEGVIALLEHPEKIPCFSYPYEWPFTMLKDAALFHLELLEVCLERGFIIKDGSSYNIQFIGPKPVFLDILSFLPYQKGEPWIGFGQFCQTFLSPLFLMSYKGIPFHPWLKSEPEGIDLYTARKFFSFSDILRPGILFNLFLPFWLQKSFFRYQESIKDKIYSRGVIKKETILKHFNKLHKTIESLPKPKIFSLWGKYNEENTYSSRDKEIKRRFVLEAVKTIQPSLLLDVGANTGEYSLLVAPYTKYLVATDADCGVIDTLYCCLKEKKIKNILPLVENIINPAPNIGWRENEYLSFSSRLKPDMVLSLALIHHIVIGKNIPLKDFLEWLIELSPNIVLEFVAKEDPMVKILLKEKKDTYFDYTIEALEYYLKTHGKILEKCGLSSGSRFLYFFKRG